MERTNLDIHEDEVVRSVVRHALLDKIESLLPVCNGQSWLDIGTREGALP